MGRGGDWPPKSFAEWMVGQNFRPRLPPLDEGQKPVLKIELSEDEASGEETLAVTYPGRRRRAGAAKQAAAEASARKVRFDGDRKPLKSALKKSSSSGSSDTTLIDTSDEESATFTDDSSDIDTSEDEAPVRQKRAKSKKDKADSCKKADPDDSSAAKDALPHPTCTCDECVKGRKILKAVIKFEAKTKAAEKTAGTQAVGRNQEKQKGKKTKANETSDATDPDTGEDEKKQSAKAKKNKKQKQKQKTSPKINTSSSAAESSKNAANKDLFKLPQYPKEMKPNLIMRPEARVVQIEHAIETPYDPRPNAFYDNGKGITRVYHGPKYANPNGKLYAECDSGKVASPRTPAGFPLGTPKDLYAPWFTHDAPGASGPVPSFGPNPAMYAQMADNEEALRKAAGQGFGLSGLPPPSMPPYFKEMQKEAAQQADWNRGSDKGSKRRKSRWSPPRGENAWQKMGSDRGSKKGDAAWGKTLDWGNENNNSKAPAPNVSSVAPADPPQDQNISGGWGGGGAGDAAWGEVDTGSKKDGGTSPHNFGGWGDNNQETFHRSSKAGGSQKQGSQKSWNGKHSSQTAASFHRSPLESLEKPNSPAGSAEAAIQTSPGKPTNVSQDGDNTWGANDKQKSGGWGDNNNNKETTWGAIGDNNGEKKPSSNASQAPPNSNPPSAANGSTGNAGGDWDNNDNNNTIWGNGGIKATSTRGGGWGNTGNTGAVWGSTSNKGASPQQFNNDQNDTWGGPPGSFPRSVHNSRPGSNAGGNEGTWGINGHDVNDKGSKSPRSSPNEHLKGIFDWPTGSGCPPGFNHTGRGSRGGSKPTWQGPHLRNPQFGAFSGSQPGVADHSGGDFYFHLNGGPSDWTNKPSDQATGPSNPADWRNPDAAQNTGGKAMNW